jgi:hypothetical protein
MISIADSQSICHTSTQTLKEIRFWNSQLVDIEYSCILVANPNP